MEIPPRHGPIDNLLITPQGQLMQVEAKLWRNPEAIGSLGDALKAAHAGLAIHYAHHVLVRDRDRGGMVIELVHRDVLP